ncbi:hypothetical protein [Nostoc flagelliforme]|nr:hypothetical protein [Nostoc flagelliforme]
MTHTKLEFLVAPNQEGSLLQSCSSWGDPKTALCAESPTEANLQQELPPARTAFFISY